MQRIALALEYGGQHYFGWQVQPDRASVQGALEAAISQIAGEPITTIAAGRTDRGVHATAQIVHFDHATNRPLSAWLRGVNSYLPPDIAVLWAQDVPPEFHARFSAQARRYRYILLNRPTRPAVNFARMAWFHAPLDVEKMQEAANFLLGEHDFSSFRASECQAKNPVKTLSHLQITRQGDQIIFDLQANAFLHHMVRNIVGALVHIGKGARDAAWIKTLLHMRDRRLAPATFAPDGLYLSGVAYPKHFALPAPCFSLDDDAFCPPEILQ